MSEHLTIRQIDEQSGAMRGEIAMVVARARNDVIGSANSLPWRMPSDLRRFKGLTTGMPIVLGRKTFESLPKALPNRMNIVLTRDISFGRYASLPSNVLVSHSIEEAITLANSHLLRFREALGDRVPQIIVAGGQEIFERLINDADRIYSTLIDQNIDGDSRFPPELLASFTRSFTADVSNDDDDYGSSFEIWRKQ